MKANGVNIFKILTFGPIKEQRNLTFGQSGIVRKFKRGWTWSLRVLENLTQEESGLYLGSDKLCTRTKASSEYIFFKGASIRHTDLYMSTSGINISNINSAPRRYPYFDVAVGLVRSHEPDSYTGGGVCYQQGLPCHTGQGRWPRQKGIPWSSRLGVGRRADNPVL